MGRAWQQVDALESAPMAGGQVRDVVCPTSQDSEFSKELQQDIDSFLAVLED